MRATVAVLLTTLWDPGPMRSPVKQGKTADAEWVKRAFDEAWKDADTALTVEGL